MLIHPAALDPGRLLADCDIRFQRRSGPGGQNRNKVETAVILSHRATGLTAEANERRSQSENRAEALFRLRLRLALEIRTSPAERPSLLWRSRCVSGKVRVNSEHTDFPALLAEALDVIADCDYEVKAAATRLGTSSSQLIRLLQSEPRAFHQVNEARRARGMRILL